jgi:hypothetical protein
MKDMPDKERVATIHVSRMSGSVLQRLLSSSLTILQSELKRASYGYLRWMLSPSEVVKTIFQNLVPFVDEVVKTGRGGVSAPERIGELFTYLALPTLELLSRVKCADDIKINIFIENKGHFRKLSHRKLFMGLGYVEVLPVLKSLLQSYMKRAHNITCTIDHVAIVESGRSPLLDLMDVVGNLTLNFFRSTLQSSAGISLSKSSKRKLRNFEDILRDINSEEYVNSLKDTIQSGFSITGNSLTPTNPSASISVFEIMQISD